VELVVFAYGNTKKQASKPMATIHPAEIPNEQAIKTLTFMQQAD